MKLFKILIAIILFYFLAILQTSFLAHFIFFGITINLILISVIIWNFLENPNDHSGIFVALIGGFFLDIYSSGLICFNILILVSIAIFEKIILKKYVRISFLEKK